MKIWDVQIIQELLLQRRQGDAPRPEQSTRHNSVHVGTRSAGKLRICSRGAIANSSGGVSWPFATVNVCRSASCGSAEKSQSADEIYAQRSQDSAPSKAAEVRAEAFR